MHDSPGHVIIAGFGVGGRFIAECLCKNNVPFVVIEMNPRTVRTQCDLGVCAIHGDASDEGVLREAGVETADLLALTMPDQKAAVRATEIARALNPRLHIIAGTQHTSAGLAAIQCGADEIVVAEQVIGHEFHRRIAARLARHAAARPVSVGAI
jgi:CPA2 family monovalent cation:H+ antiporter-2